MKLAIVLVLAAAAPAGAQPQSEIDRLLIDGVELRGAGKLDTALAKFAEARAKARAAQLPKSEALAALQMAATLEETPDPAAAAQAETEYRYALSLPLDPSTQAVARNNLAYLLLRNGKNSERALSEALDQFRRIPYAQLAPAQAMAYSEHRGDLLLKAGQPVAALGRYMEVLRTSPSESAWTSAFAAVHKLPSGRWTAATEVLDTEIQNGTYSRAASDAINFLASETARQPAGGIAKEVRNVNELLERLLRAYAGDTPAIADFQGRDRKILQDTGALLKEPNAHAAGMAAELIDAFGGKLSTPHSLKTTERTFRHLLKRPERERYLAVLLKNIAAQYRRQSQPAEAVPRLAASWWIDPSATATAVNLAVVIHDNPDLDPQLPLARELSAYYVSASWLQTASRLITDFDPGKTQLQLRPEDWRNLVTMYQYLEPLTKSPTETTRKERAGNRSGVVRPQESIAGDRFIFRYLPAQGENIRRVRVFVRPKESGAQSYLQAISAVVDSESKSFFGVFDRPLQEGQILDSQPVTTAGGIAGAQKQPVAPSHHQQLMPNLEATWGALRGRSSGGYRYGLHAELNADGAIRGWYPSTPSPDRTWLETLRRPSFGGGNFMLRYTAGYRLDMLPVSLEPAAGATERYSQTLETGLYLPAFAESLGMRVYHSRYLIYAAPMLRVGAHFVRGTTEAPFANAAMRIGWMRSPITLRAVPTEFRSFVEVSHGTGTALRRQGDGYTQPRQTRITVEAFGFGSPFLAGFFKTLGPGPRDVRLYAGLRLDVASAHRLLHPKPPAQ